MGACIHLRIPLHLTKIAECTIPYLTGLLDLFHLFLIKLAYYRQEDTAGESAWQNAVLYHYTPTVSLSEL